MFRTPVSALSGALAVFAAASLTVGCALTGNPFATDTADAPRDVNPDATTACRGGELDNCFNRDQMGEFVHNGERLVIDYLTQIGITHDSLPTLTYIPATTTASSKCVDRNDNPVQHDRSYDYCPADNTVYTGQNILWDVYRQYGAAGPISGLAHEYGHFLQSVAGVPDPSNATETIRHEDQADCISGAFLGYLAGRGLVEYPKDLDNVGLYLAATASAEGPGRDHGTADERTQSFGLGYRGALPACNKFYPATPLTT